MLIGGFILHKFIRTYISVFALIGIFSCINKSTVEVNSFKNEKNYGFEVVSTEKCRVCVNSEMQIVQLEKVNPKLDKEKIKLEIEKSELVMINGIGRNSKVSYSIADSNICKIEKVSLSKYSIVGLKDGATSVEFIVNGDSFPLEVEVWHNCRFGEWSVVKDSTCFRKGSKERYCTICNSVETEEIEKKQHNYKDCVCTECYSTLYTNDVDNEIVLTESICSENGIPRDGNVVIPKYVSHKGKKYKVVGIGVGLFISRNITFVELPDSIRYIGEYAFDGCEKLKKCELKEGVGYIGKAAFQCCYALEMIDLPDSVWFVGNFAFNHNSGLRNKEIKLPDSLEHLGEDIHCPAHMFYDCGMDGVFDSFSISKNNKYYKVIDGILYTRDGKTLVSIPVGKKFKNGVLEIPKGVENLGELSFSRNKNVKEIVIPDSLAVDSSISEVESRYYLNNGNDLSVGCYGYSGVERYSCYPDSERYQCIDGVLYSKDLSRLIAVPNQYSGDLAIPEGVKDWSKEAIWSEVEYFRGMAMNKIRSIEIPKSIISIDERQIEVINNLVDMYCVRVSSNNSKYVVRNGYLVCK